MNANPMMMINMIMQSNPNLAKYWQTAQKMTQGKSPEQIQQIANNLAKQNGLDMNQVNQTIRQFLGGQFPGNT